MRRLVLLLPIIALLVSGGLALTAGNTITQDIDRDVDTRTQGTANVTPQACKDYGITRRVVSNDLTVTGNSDNELILGGAADQSISGLGGNDCIYGGAGNDTIDGGTGTNRIDGGPGSDTCLNAAVLVDC